MNTSLSQYAIIFAWLLMLNIVGTCSFNIHCNQKDKHALLNFKQGVIDPSGVLSSWSTQQDCCQWKGVMCNNITSRVTTLSLPCHTTLPTYTDKVDKSHCLTGSIHLSLVEFEFLNYLDLSNNDFLAIHFDPVDSQTCHNISADTTSRQCVNSSVLGYFDLSDNTNLIIDSLEWLSRISSLDQLDLSAIDLHREVDWLRSVTMLPSLSYLVMRGCQLEDLSPSLEYANFTTLKLLDLSDNEFDSELPKWLFNLSSGITDVHLGSNSLRGQLPKALLNLRHLESLTLEHNKLNGPIPDWLGQFELLQVLNLQENMFSGSIPTNLGNLSSLISLAVNANQLTGVLSERNFAKLSKLKVLIMGISPPLIFDFDSHWVPPFQLEQLSFSFAGPNLPTWFYTQTSIDFLSIVYSSFQIENEFHKFVSRRMIMLDLESNSIDGDMSEVLLNSTFIIISSNDLKGGLPRLSSNVVGAVLLNNSLSGSISSLLCDHEMSSGKSNLKFLDISLNNLSGGLTNCWKNWRTLMHINLGSNNLTGQIPPSMGLLHNLTTLHLHQNKLYGEIPQSLRNCHSLLIFNVRENNFSGNIPNWIVPSAVAIQLRSNQFSGTIPEQICQMPSLIIFDFADNNISGHIPNCLHHMTSFVFNNASKSKLTFYIALGNIYYECEDSLDLITKGQGLHYNTNLHFVTLIDLSSNELSGSIPPQMFNLVGLHSLNLSFNKLVGRIPEEIGNMKNLESLDLSTNQLSGEIPEIMSKLTFLGYLNVSFNNFRGRIPSGTQLGGFNASSYMGNPGLCGPPLTKYCPQDTKSEDMKPYSKDNDGSHFLSWFYIGLASGFVTGFWGVCGTLFFNRKCRHAYFTFLYDLRDRFYVMIVTKRNLSPSSNKFLLWQ
ncbi:hypothetical protein RJT34_05083 [Clitoria ternatea]|uniref:Leucine-rich repeat-containing N-terminal plant-type domain-containing protein n=1 Tax=Clitoria ternatea TaxID=43366 RepID=A0AAN9PSU6_CLITE